VQKVFVQKWLFEMEKVKFVMVDNNFVKTEDLLKSFQTISSKTSQFQDYLVFGCTW